MILISYFIFIALIIVLISGSIGYLIDNYFKDKTEFETSKAILKNLSINELLSLQDDENKKD